MTGNTVTVTAWQAVLLLGGVLLLGLWQQQLAQLAWLLMCCQAQQVCVSARAVLLSANSVSSCCC